MLFKRRPAGRRSHRTTCINVVVLKLVNPNLVDNVHHYAQICEVISVRLVMAVTSYPIFSHHGDHDEQVK
jgi:hypothetical protein